MQPVVGILCPLVAVLCCCSESVDGSNEEFDDMDFGYEVELDQYEDDTAGMSYDDDQYASFTAPRHCVWSTVLATDKQGRI